MVLAALILHGLTDLREANALKNVAPFASSLMAVLVFGLAGTVVWSFALVMVISSALSGYFGEVFR